MPPNACRFDIHQDAKKQKTRAASIAAAEPAAKAPGSKGSEVGHPANPPGTHLERSNKVDPPNIYKLLLSSPKDWAGRFKRYQAPASTATAARAALKLRMLRGLPIIEATGRCSKAGPLLVLIVSAPKTPSA